MIGGGPSAYSEDKYSRTGEAFDKRSTNSSTTKTGAKTTAAAAVLSKEEKLRQRQEQLKLWKKKKSGDVAAKSEGEATPDPEMNDKKLLRQKRLEEWKKKKQEQTSGKAVVTSEGQNVAKRATPRIKINSLKMASNLLKTKKRPVFDLLNDEDADVERKRPVFKKPVETGGGSNGREDSGKNIDKEVDELDKYVAQLEHDEQRNHTKNGQDPNLGIGEVNALDSGEESDDDVKQQRLLSSKLEKLQNKEKQLGAVDHEKVEYLPFRKSFYKESPEILRMSEEEVELLRMDLEGIRIRGHDCPRPVSNWSQLGLSSSIMSIIEDKLRYNSPSPIQAQALPAIMLGRDIIGVAKTGSGKTLSFLLPLLRHIKDQPELASGEGPVGLIMSPTRELALQIYKELTNFTKKVGITASCCFGGSPIEAQIAELKRGTQVLVGTPGRIIDLLAANGGRVTNLKRVTYLVLDEADRMFDMGFEAQVTKVLTRVRPDRQTVLFSATFPKKIEFLAKKVLNDPLEISVGGISIVPSEITQRVELFEIEAEDEEARSHLSDKKFNRLKEILYPIIHEDKPSKILIFVETQVAADDLLVKLLGAKYACLAIHGGKDQMDRKYAVKEFSSMESGIDILIATSIAARGLDVKGLNLVINFDAANHMEDYVHRVGRTGRAGMKGSAITFVSSQQERAISDLVRALKLSKVPDTEIDPRLLECNHKFLDKVKSGNAKYAYGFGGKGLENLQELRDSNRDIQRKVYGDPQEQASENSTITKQGANSEATTPELPDFDIIEGRAPETSGPDMSKYHARITINDLPQTARWITVNRDSLSKIIESTGTSITNKGQYYPPNAKMPKPTKQNGKEIPPPPKLYLLVEGLTEAAVHEAVNMIRDKMIEGLEVAAKDKLKVPTGRYTV